LIIDHHFRNIVRLKIDHVRRKLENLCDAHLLVNGALLGRLGIDRTTGLITVCRDCETSLENNATPKSALSRIFSPDYMSDDE
jgi:hypothetical protein